MGFHLGFCRTEIAVARGRCDDVQGDGLDWAGIRCSWAAGRIRCAWRRRNRKRHKIGTPSFRKGDSSMNQVSSISPQAIMAEAVSDATKKGRTLDVEGMSRLFLDLKKKGIAL